MEQEVFPKKIKLVALFMIVIGIFLLGKFIFITWLFKTQLSQMDGSQYNISWFVLTKFDTLLIAALFILFALFLLKNKKWAWFAAMVLLLKEAVGGISSLSFFTIFSDQILYLKEFLKELQATIAAPIFTFSIVAIIISILIYVLILISLVFLIKYRKNYLQISS
jgi:hypothetical protein